MEEPVVRVYGEDWCPDCRRAKQVLSRLGVPFEWLDTGRDPEAREFVKKTLPGRERIPVIVFPDGSYLVEPTNEELEAKLSG